MVAKQSYLRQAELCIRLADETLDTLVAERLRAIAADFLEKANGAGHDDVSVVPPDIAVGDGERRG